MANLSAAEKGDLVPTGKLRAGINFANTLLTGKDATGKPFGIALDLAYELGNRLGVPVEIIEYPTPGKLAEAAPSNVWDVGFLGAEPARAKVIDFAPAYVEIEATYLVTVACTRRAIADFDSEGVRIVVPAKSAYELYLTRTLKHARLILADGSDNAFRQFVADKADALAGLRSQLEKDKKRLPGARLIDGHFTSVQQAIGTPKGRAASATYLYDFVENVKASGLVAQLIEKYGMGRELSVAAAALPRIG